jgi:hypothetical protein
MRIIYERMRPVDSDTQITWAVDSSAEGTRKIIHLYGLAFVGGSYKALKMTYVPLESNIYIVGL